MSPSILASLAAADAGGVTRLFTMLAVLVIAARLGGSVAQRFGQPSVLGELVAGILVGPSLLHVVDPTLPLLHLLAEFGVVILLFQIGLHTNLGDLLKVGPAATTVGVVGVAIPFALGYVVAHAMGLGTLAAILAGASLTATSIGISARILGDLGHLGTPEGRTVLGAAVLDDVIGLVILAVCATMASGGTIDAAGLARTVGAAVGFLVVALVAGRVLAPRLFGLIARIPASGTTGALALAFALLLAAAAEWAGSAPIIGAFAAGLILHATPQRETIEEASTSIGHVFVPVFFASVGAAVDIGAMRGPFALQLGGALLLVGIAGKFVAGYAPFWLPLRSALVGAAMVPRGEVGLIFARMGLETGAMTPEIFGAVMLMVIGTTFVTPPWLAWLAKRTAPTGRAPEDLGGLDDLVSGER